jgi:endonuclease YncB( thermonuclease family)
VIDGDTIRALYDGKTEAMRLDGVDCPEQNRLLGRRAKAFTSSAFIVTSLPMVLTHAIFTASLYKLS